MGNAPVVITKKEIEDRIKLLECERANTIQTMSAYDGAIQDCKHWLVYLEEKTSKK